MFRKLICSSEKIVYRSLNSILGIPLDFRKLEQKPRLTIGSNAIYSCGMAANNDYLLFASNMSLALVDARGEEQYEVRENYDVKDICWSSSLEQFIILTVAALSTWCPSTPQMVEVKHSSEGMCNCTCNVERLMVTIHAADIAVFDLKSNFRLVKTYKQPVSCGKDQNITAIGFSSDGTQLGVVLDYFQRESSWFESRDASDLRVLRTVTLAPSMERYCIISLPTAEFLVYSCRAKDLSVIDTNGRLKQTIVSSVNNGGICSAAFIPGQKCLVLETCEPRILCFYDL